MVHFNDACAAFSGLLWTPPVFHEMTIEFWHRAETQLWSGTMIDMRDGPVSDAPNFTIAVNGPIGLEYSEMGRSLIGGPIVTMWKHIAFVRYHDHLWIFEDGLFINANSTFPVPFAPAVTDFFLGCEFDESIGSFVNMLNEGWIDELRVSDVARYQPGDSFTPNAHYEPDAFTIGLYHFDNDAPPDYIEDSSPYGNHGSWVMGSPIYEPAEPEMCP